MSAPDNAILAEINKLLIWAYDKNLNQLSFMGICSHFYGNYSF